MQRQYKAEGKLFPRAHLSLIGFNNSGYRKYGGIGFCFNSPFIEFHVEESKKMEINLYFLSQKIFYLNEALIDTLSRICENKGLDTKYCFSFFLDCPLHSGFGTGTNISLACIESVYKINRFEYLPEDLIILSNRGRTSGIGIHTYFKGGFIMDIGVKNLDSVFLPSNTNNSSLVSKQMLSISFPEWEFVVCIPRNIIPLSKQEEISFFRNNTPLLNEDVFRILYVSVFGVVSSVIESDFPAFCQSINDLQKTKWKYLEKLNYGKQMDAVEKTLIKAGASAIAMSSLGPSLLVFSNDILKLTANLDKLNDEFIYFKTSSNNAGRLIYA